MGEMVKAETKKPEARKENRASQTQKAGPSQSISSPVEQILFFQRTIGNQAVGRFLKSGALQTKLRIGQLGDIYEQEAERMAEQVIRMPEPQVSKETKVSNRSIEPHNQLMKKDKEKPLRTKDVGHSPEITPELESRISAIRGGGQPLPESVRDFMEQRFGQDFSQVRVYTDEKGAESARAVNARAFTMERDIVFGTGQYAPETSVGRRLLAHELTHVVQQKNKCQGNVLQCWKLKSSEDCLVKGANRAKSLLIGNPKQSELVYSKWGCKTKEFIDNGKGPELEIKYGGTSCAVSWKDSSGEDLISINPGLIDCCKDCPDQADAVETIAHTIIHETAHWCAATHKKSTDVEHGDDVESAFFGGVSILENCIIKKVSSYKNKPCFSCPYVVKKGDNLWKIAEKLYADSSIWLRIYKANRKLIGDNPNLIHPGMRLIIPPLEVRR